MINGQCRTTNLPWVVSEAQMKKRFHWRHGGCGRLLWRRDFTENSPCAETEIFFKAFRAKGRFSEFLAWIPVHVILNDKAALLGAAHAAFEPLGD